MPFWGSAAVCKRLLPALLWALPLLLFSTPAELLMLASAVLLHEGGHLVGFFLMREPCPSLSAVAAGLLLSPTRPIAYRREIPILLLGPLFNLALAIPLLLFCRTAGGVTLAAVHLFSALCNLLPLRRNDGGRALYDALALFTDPDTAERISALTSSVFLILLILLFLFFLLSPGGGGVILLLIALLSHACAPA